MRFRSPAKPEHEGPWFIEVDFGDGWAVYSPTLPTRAAAEVFAYDLRAIGRTEGELPPDSTAAAPKARRKARKPPRAA
jgi:hypothetical protein